MGLGMGEVVVVLVIALMVFGPRKLPELGKSLGQAMNQFRRASDEFKRTWEQEVEYDKVRNETAVNTLPSANTDENGQSYHAESDYHYGYDHMSSSDEVTTTAVAAETSNVLSEPKTGTASPAVVAEKKTEPQWI